MSAGRVEARGEQAAAPTPRVRAWYPALVAAWLVVRMASANVDDLRGPGDLLRPLVISLGLVLGAQLLLRAAVRDPHRRGLLALLLVLWFATIPVLHPWIARSGILAALLPWRRAVLSTALLTGVVMAGVLALRRVPVAVTRYLNATALLLLLLPVPVLARGLRRGGAPALEWPLPPAAAVAAADSTAAAARPDVYLVILDKYTGVGSLKARWDFDDEPFLRALEARGFVTPRHARANYVHTHLALSSMLNWRYLDVDSAAPTVEAGAVRRSMSRIEANRTVATFRAHGYRTLFLPSAYETTVRSRLADVELDVGLPRWSEFETEWWRTTALRPAETSICPALPAACAPLRHRDALDSPAAMRRRFELLATLADSAGPKFVFAHLTVPHEPYILDADCSPVDVAADLDSAAAEPAPQRDARVRRRYVGQIRCVNQLVLTLVDSLDRRSRVRPVILLQADHGHGRITGVFGTRGELSPDQVAERLDVFAAYRYAGAERAVYDSITPINALPAALDAVLGTRLPRQPDESWWSSWQRPFALERVR